MSLSPGTRMSTYDVAAPGGSPKPSSILIVEDEAIVARDIRQMLEELGYEVAGNTPTGEEAVRMAGEVSPNLVLMDIHLAGKMDGIEAAQQIRRRYGSPVVFLTAFADGETLERAKLSEPFGYVIKPFDTRYLRTAIEIGLYKHGVETRLRHAYEEQATILRTALDAYFLADPSGRILDVNDSSCRMLGYSREELLKMSLSDLDLEDEDPEIENLDDAAEWDPVLFERTQRCKDGRLLRVEMSVNYLNRGGGRVFRFVRDITRRRRPDEDLPPIPRRRDEGDDDMGPDIRGSFKIIAPRS